MEQGTVKQAMDALSASMDSYEMEKYKDRIEKYNRTIKKYPFVCVDNEKMEVLNLNEKFTKEQLSTLHLEIRRGYTYYVLDNGRISFMVMWGAFNNLKDAQEQCDYINNLRKRK